MVRNDKTTRVMKLRYLSFLCFIFPLLWVCTLVSLLNSCSISEVKYVELGKYNFKEKKYDKAIKYFTEALSINPKNVSVLESRVRCYLYIDSLNLAIGDCNKMIEILPSGDTYYLRGSIYHSFAQDTLAKYDFMKACDLTHNRSCDLIRQYYK